MKNDSDVVKISIIQRIISFIDNDLNSSLTYIIVYI